MRRKFQLQRCSYPERGWWDSSSPLQNMTTTITIFYYILNTTLMNDKELDIIDKEMDSNMRKCLTNGFAVSNFQDKIFH